MKLSKTIQDKIIGYEFNSPIEKHWFGDPRFSPDGIIGIITPMITRGSPSNIIKLKEDLTPIQRNKVLRLLKDKEGYFTTFLVHGKDFIK